jgi:hypothetical protein
MSRLTVRQSAECLAAFLSYCASLWHLLVPFPPAIAERFDQARFLLFPPSSHTLMIQTWDDLVTNKANRKFVMLAYSWLLVNMWQRRDARFWKLSVFSGAQRNLKFATAVLKHFEARVQNVLNYSTFACWLPQQHMGDLSFPVKTGKSFTGAFSYLQRHWPAPTLNLTGFFGRHLTHRLQSPLPGEDICKEALMSQYNLSHDDDNSGDGSLPAVLVHPPSSPVQEVVDSPDTYTFKHYSLAFNLSVLSNAGVWLTSHLSVPQLAAVRQTQRLPLNRVTPPLTVIRPGQPVLDEYGLPWFRADGSLVTNSHKTDSPAPTTAQSQAFYSSAIIPSIYTTYQGYLATVKPNSIYSGVDECSDDEAESQPSAARHGTKPRNPTVFNGYPATSPKLEDFIAWARQMDKWFAVDSFHKHERSVQASQYLAGVADDYWCDQQATVLKWYAEHLPGKYLTPSGQPYVPWTAMKKVLAERFADDSLLTSLRNQLEQLTRAADVSAIDYNAAFLALHKAMLTFGQGQGKSDNELIAIYRNNSHLSIPIKYQPEPNKPPVPFTTLRSAMMYGEGQYQTRAADIQVNALSSRQPATGGNSTEQRRQQPHGSTGPRAQLPARSSGTKRGRTPRSTPAADPNLIAAIQTLASFQGGNSSGSKRRAPYFNQQDSFRGGKRQRFANPSAQPPSNFNGPPHCGSCGKIGHTTNNCPSQTRAPGHRRGRGRDGYRPAKQHFQGGRH